MTLVFLPLVLILQFWLSKPNPTLARTVGSLPALLLSTQRLFITSRVLAGSSSCSHYFCGTQLFSVIFTFMNSLLSITLEINTTQKHAIIMRSLPMLWHYQRNNVQNTKRSSVSQINGDKVRMSHLHLALFVLYLKAHPQPLFCRSQNTTDRIRKQIILTVAGE